MNKAELKNKVGEKWYFADENSLEGELIYISGINEFDNELKVGNQFERGELIHLTEMPKGLIISLAKNFSSIKYGIAFSKLVSFSFSTFEYYSVFEIKTKDSSVLLVLRNDQKSEVVDFFKKFYPSKSFDEAKTKMSPEIINNIEDTLLRHSIYLIPFFDNDIKASKLKRAFNFIIDHLIVVITYQLLLFPNFNNYQSSYLYALILLYFLFFEVVFNTTIGKIITSTKIVSNNGTNPKNIFIRTLARFIPLEPLSFVFFDNGWHDKISKTQVIDISKRKIALLKSKK